MEAAVDGTLTPFKRDKLINEGALQQLRASFLGDIKRGAERLFAAEFHRALNDGGGDQILDSLRPSFDQAAEQINAARDLIPADTNAEIFLHSAEPAALSAWQKLNDHIAIVASIGSTVSQFGCRLGKFVLIEEYANADNFRLDDKAITCTDGNLETDSQLFMRPDQWHRSSPWFRLSLRLHSVDSMRSRYREWAAGQWEQQHSGPPQRWIDAHGVAHEQAKPENPFKAKVSA